VNEHFDCPENFKPFFELEGINKWQQKWIDRYNYESNTTKLLQAYISQANFLVMDIEYSKKLGKEMMARYARMFFGVKGGVRGKQYYEKYDYENYIPAVQNIFVNKSGAAYLNNELVSKSKK
jgi:hypothetical protein